MFFNEYDILEGRLEYLYDTVDYFVIVESDRTHNGKSKPLNYAENIERYRKYQEKILYLPLSIDVSNLTFNKVDQFDYESTPWKIEMQQRRHISTALKLFGPDDIILIGDLDEIPSKSAIKIAVDSLGIAADAFALEQDMFYYNLKQKQVNVWKGTVLTKNSFAQTHGVQILRDARFNLTSIWKGGWHLSYWNTIENIQNKIKNFAHQEYNTPEFTDLNNIKQRVQQGKDLFNRENATGNLQVVFEPVDRSSLPEDFLNVFAKFEPNQNYIPHFYQTVEGWFNYGDFVFYKEIIDKFNGPAHFVEIGSYKGKSASFMAVEIANSGKRIKFDCVDTWLGSPEHQKDGNLPDWNVINGNLFDIFKQNMEPVKNYYKAKRMTSLRAAATYPDNSLDFVFIDADHSYEAIRADIIAWWPKVKIGGIISGHDFHLGAPGVVNATNELFGYVRVTGSCWWYEKEAPI